MTPTRQIFCVGIALVLSTLAILLVDFYTELGVATGVLYVIPIALCYFIGGMRTVLWTTIAASILILAGYWISPSGSEAWKVIANRILSLFVIWMVALPCFRLLRVNDALDDANALTRLAAHQRESLIQKRRTTGNVLTDLKSERQKFIDVINELSFPPHRSDTMIQERASLQEMTLCEMIVCSREIRRLTLDYETDHDYSAGLMKFLHEHFRAPNGESELALVRLFRTRSFNELNEKAKRVALELPVKDPARTLYLALEGTYGDQEDWCRPEKSQRHFVFPYGGDEGLARSKMLMEMLRQSGVDTGARPRPSFRCYEPPKDGGYCYIPQAEGCQYIPDQERFVKRFGIKSIVGFADQIGDDIFLLVGFSKVPISDAGAELFSHLRHSTCIGLNAFYSSADTATHRIRAIERLIRSKERIVMHQDQRLRATLTRLSESNDNLVKVNSELEQFAYVASHDLRSPLRGISNTARFVMEDDGNQLSDSSQGYLDKMVGRIRRMENLLNDLLKYSRTGREEAIRERIDTRVLLTDIIDLLPIPDHLSIHLPDSMPVLDTHVTPLRQVLLNLIGNAIRHSGPDATRVDIEFHQTDDQWVITVADDGIGIAPEHQEKIFEMFRTLQNRDDTEGSGMGLAIVRKSVRHYGGDIRVESWPGNGTRFIVTWPVHHFVEDSHCELQRS